MANIGSDEILVETGQAAEHGAGVCLGRPVGGIEVRIIRIVDEPIRQWHEDACLPAMQVGEIAVKGAVVTTSYHERPESSLLAKIPDTEGSIWHRMGDLGYRDGRGRLWFCGRKSHRVETPEGTLFTIPCEGVFNAHPDVLRSALVGVKREGRNWPVVCVELEKTRVGRPRKELAQELASWHWRTHTHGPLRCSYFTPVFRWMCGTMRRYFGRS